MNKFQYNEMLKKKKPQVVSSPPKDLYYMKQTISNACGTVAMMHAIANNKAKYDLIFRSLYSEALLLVPWLIVQPSYLFKFSLCRLNSRVVKLLGFWFICSDPSLLFNFWP